MNGIRAATIGACGRNADGRGSGRESSPEQLALLDPSARMAGLCSGRDGGSSMRAHADARRGRRCRPKCLPRSRSMTGSAISTSRSPPPTRWRSATSTRAWALPTASTMPPRSPRSARRRGSIPACAMCWWGEALAHGPNINAPLTPDANALALKAVAQAQRAVGQCHPARARADHGAGQALFGQARRRCAPSSTVLMPTRC